MARGQSKSQLKALRKKYKLGEFRSKKSKTKKRAPKKNPRPPGGIRTEKDKLDFFNYYNIPALPGGPTPR